uniref:NADPH:adrenodoxin oxidoreductase, mitochondrial n=1 Tax=Caenorhabditis tropicalis TaxID=1561998 RepID=A0A1I7TE43_9PELO
MLVRRLICRIEHASFFIKSRSLSSKPRLAIVGSGPAGMFACNGLLRKSNFAIDVFEYSPVPFGLVRYGVAPDHQEVKNVINTFDNMFEKNRDRLKLFCNVNIGRDITFDELTRGYDAVLLAYGSYKTRKLNVPGSDSKNVISGSEFVGWYNGVPNATTPDLSTSNVVIVGNGNVALDCARVLSTASSGSLRISDIPDDRLSILEKATVKDIKILGRRGPEHVSFTIKELREQFKINEWDSKLELSEEDQKNLIESLPKLERKKRRLTEVLVKNIGVASGQRQCHFLFHRVPKRVIADSNGIVREITVENIENEKVETFACGLLIYSIGYETLVLDGVPQNQNKMIDMKDHCRVNMDISCPANVYATGWCAHGPRGVIVDTQQQSIFVADQIASDFAHNRKRIAPGIELILKERKIPFISWDAWKLIDQQERDKGKLTGKIREKFTTFEKFLSK